MPIFERRPLAADFVTKLPPDIMQMCPTESPKSGCISAAIATLVAMPVITIETSPGALLHAS